ncbi:LemA family protein [Snodgrassella sp. B3882]|uniref:LemA family protein n=1 Tax=Snodgrassella sp. B3882 TaxID=2818037 RepID=UPI00226ADDF9|nr:LemA family protein [Snodgrassella sp. B3882]MCX8745293.1 LemA family protein [Snodgrassella sp. B3882]
MFKQFRSWAVALLLIMSLSGCGYNTLQSQDEAANAAWSEVLNQYQRRADLVPNLVNTVKGYANHEQKVLTDVTNARAKVGSMNMTSTDATDENKMKQFSQAQGELSNSLSRLLVVSENYPDLKADKNFKELQAQLEGTENRIALARNRYIKNVQEYNTTLRSFPNNLTAKVFGMHIRPNFVPENEAAVKQAPQVQF